MSSVWVILRDDGDTEVLAVYTVDAMASATVDDLNEAAARCGTTERFRAIRVDLNSGDKLPGQWVETTREVSPGLHLPVYAVDGYLPRDVMARFFPEWQPWPTAYGVKP